MPDEPPDDEPPRQPLRKLDVNVGAKESRKLRARVQQDRTIWFGLGSFGLIGWSVAIPILAGIALGIWLDVNWPSRVSWTLTFLLAGAGLGCLNAWYWVSQEQQAMDREHERSSNE